jgi:hypothetical protein
MVSTEPTGPYVYQPYGSSTNPRHNVAGRLWGVAGLVDHPIDYGLVTIKGLTKEEATVVCTALLKLRTRNQIANDTPPATVAGGDDR